MSQKSLVSVMSEKKKERPAVVLFSNLILFLIHVMKIVNNNLNENVVSTSLRLLQ